MARKRAASVQETLEVNQWVRVFPAEGWKKAKTIDRWASTSYALVSALLPSDGSDEPGQAAVLYPNRFVLQFSGLGYAGRPLVREVVCVSRLRPLAPEQRSKELEELEKQLRKAVISEKQRQAEGKTDKAKPEVEQEVAAEAAPEVADVEKEQSTPQKERRMPEEDSSEKVSSIPAKLTPETPEKIPAPNRRVSKVGKDRQQEFTKLLSQLFQKEGVEERLTRTQITSAFESSFPKGELEVLLQRLEDANKIMQCDELVFFIC